MIEMGKDLLSVGVVYRTCLILRTHRSEGLLPEHCNTSFISYNVICNGRETLKSTLEGLLPHAHISQDGHVTYGDHVLRGGGAAVHKHLYGAHWRLILQLRLHHGT